MKIPIISVVVLSYNYGDFLKKCLDSVFTQKKVDEFEIFLIDDASSDNTPEVAKSI